MRSCFIDIYDDARTIWINTFQITSIEPYLSGALGNRGQKAKVQMSDRTEYFTNEEVTPLLRRIKTEETARNIL